MAYSRREVEDGKTVMNKDLYDNLQDGIDEVKEALAGVVNNPVIAATVESDS